MSKAKFAIILTIFMMVTFAIGVVLANVFPRPIEQPIKFNHKLHMDPAGAGMKCIDCHKYYLTQRNSGRPGIEVCKSCHDDGQGNPEKMKLQAYADKDQEIPWKRIYYLKDFVRYPHSRHTDKIACETCHGPMAEQTQPPGARLVAHSMAFCIDCHKKNNATLECLSCHK